MLNYNLVSLANLHEEVSEDSNFPELFFVCDLSSFYDLSSLGFFGWA